jgi:hypothetical protein
MTNEFAAEKTPRELLAQFYEKYGLGDDGGHSDNKVRIEISKNMYFYLPNWDERRRALLIHDIHHLVTGYHSDFQGETEISSWEIGSNCRNYWAAWILNAYGMTAGFWFNLPGIFQAFVRGRHSLNLYGDSLTAEQALDMPIGTIRDKLHLLPLDKKLSPTTTDITWFLISLVLGALFGILSLALVPFLILYNIYLFLTLRMAKS